MPQVAVALLKIGFFVFEAFAGAAAAATLGAGAAVAIGAAVVVGGTLIAKQAMSLFEVEMPTVDTDASRQRTVRSTTEPQKIIYGEALVSGPISFIGLSGTDNSDLYQTIVLAGHELNDITDIHMDDIVITDSQINGGSDAGGNVTAGTFGPKNSSTICVIKKHLGEASQTADVLLTGPFANYTSAHRGDGIAYLAMKWVLNEYSAETWDKFAPSNVKALVQGKSIYDPRLEFAAVETRGQDTTNASYITYSTNPALCVVDYLTDTYLGMGVSVSKIDWDSVTTAADGCDVSVSVPGGTESRFTCNGVVFATDSHQKNINKILSSMNGNLVYSNGKYILHAGIYEAPTETLTEDDLIGAISIKTSLERSDRFNTIKGLFIDPSQNHKSSEFPKVQLADAVTRDNNEILEKEVQYPMTNSSYMAQRLSNKLIQLSDQQKVVSFPANLSALRITAGDRVQVSVEELNWSNKVFQCAGWTFSEDGGVNLTLREDSSTSYADPAVNEYSTVTATGVITDAFRGVPSPSGLTATAGLKSNELNWVNPGNPSDFGTIYVYASRNANFSSAIKIGETNGTQFIHDGSNKAQISFPTTVNVGDTYTIRTLGNTDFVAMGAASNTVGVVFTATATGSGTGNLWATIASGDLRYYWVRAVKNVGTDAASQSNLEPNADPNTTVFATVGRVEWADVAGSTDAPANNATAGAQISVDLFDADGTTVMSQADVKNSVLAQEILEVEVEAGEVLNLETGQDVDIQNLGDVAIYVSDSNQTLNTSINTVANNLSALETVVVDLTSGVSEVFIQATEPVAGVGGIPDPIPDFSRWYDSSENNQPHYWSGTDWEDLRDGQTTQNAAAITNLQTSLTTTNSNVTTNANAITALDVTTVAQGNSITSIAADVTALEVTVDDPTTGVAATSTALGNLTTRVTTAEGSITTNASDITTLQTDVSTAEGNITTNASAISGLDTRVTTAEGSIVSQASDITALETTVNNGTTGVAANASGLTALTTRVTNTEGATTVNAGAVTTLNATYTEDLHFRTQAEDENDDLIDLETSGTVELQDLTDFVSGSSAAIDSLTVQTFANENGIQTQAIQLTALESTVNDPTNGVVATAGALSSLSTTVSVIDGQVTSTAQDLTTLTTTVGGNTASITTQATSIDGVEANYSVKIDNNNRITGFGLLSTTSGATPFSEFAVVADQFSIVSPDSTADTPIQPFTVTADKIFFGADVVISGDLISTGTISADRLQIDGVMFDTETVGGVTSLIIKESGINTSQIAESAITTARLSNDAVTVDKFANTLQSTNYVADTSGWQILTSGDVEFQNAKITGEITATSGSISNTVTVGGTAASTVASGAAAGATANQDSTATILGGNLTGQVDGTAVATIKSGAASGATAVQDSDTGLTLGLQAGSAGPVTISYTAASGGDPEVAKLYQGDGTFNNSNTGFYLDNSGNFSLQDKLAFNGSTLAVDGEITSVSGTIGGFTLGSTSLTAGDGTTRVSLSTADGIHLGDNTFASAPFRVTPAGAVTATSVNITGTVDASTNFTFNGTNVTGTMNVANLDVAGIITTGALITDSATIANDIRIGSGEAVFSADQYGIYLGNETFADAEFSVTPAGVLTATGADITGAITATSGAFTGAVNVGTTGKFYGGTSVNFNTGNGFFLGYDSNAYKLSVGNASTGTALTWDGEKLNVDANVVSFTTGGQPDYNSNSRFPTSLRSSVLDLSSNADYVFFDNSFDQNLTLYASFYAGPLTSGTISGLSNAQNAIMSNLSIQIQYAANVGGSPGTWTNFGSAALSSAKFTSGQLNSNYYVKTTDLGGGNYRADLATSNQAAQDFTGIGYSEFAYGITDEDYYMTEQVTVYGFPKGEYFLRVVVGVTNGSYSPYPSTGSPDVTNPRRISIPNAITYEDSNHGTSSVAKGSPISYFTGSFNNTSINGGSLTIAVNEENPISNRYGGIFIAGRGETTVADSIRPLGGIWFYNGVDDLGSGAGDLGSPNHGLFVPKTGDSLNIEASGNGIKFNGGYGSTGATIDTNGNISTDGKIITNDLDITAPASSDAVLKFIEDGSSYPSWKIRADVGSDSVMYFNQYNGSNTATGTIAFTSTGGILATGAGSYGNGFANGGVSISSDGNYQGAGNINITGTVTQGSDARLKTAVETIDGSKVFDMRGVSFIKAGKKGAGVIAQELQEIAPELVHANEDGVLSVAYGDIVGYLIEAIKTLKQEIESIKADD